MTTHPNRQVTLPSALTSLQSAEKPESSSGAVRPPSQLLHNQNFAILKKYFSQKHELCYNRPALKHPHAEHTFKPPAEPLERNTDTQELVIKSLPHSEWEHTLRTGVNQAA